MDVENFSQKPWEERSPEDRRSEKDARRSRCETDDIAYSGTERRRRRDRRQEGERRDGWLRIKRWKSVRVFDK